MSKEMDLETMERVEILKEEVIAQLQRAPVALLTEICVEQSIVIPPRKAGIKSALANLVVLFLSSSTIEESGDYGEQMFLDLKQKLDERLGPRVVEASVSGEVKGDAEGKPLKSAPTQLEDHANSSTAKVSDGVTVSPKQNVKVGGLHGAGLGANGGGSHGAGLGATGVWAYGTGLGPNGAGALGAGLGADGGGAHGAGLGATAGTVLDPRHLIRRAKIVKEFKIHSGTIGGENQLSMDDLLYQIDEGQTLGYTIEEIVSGVIRATKPGSSLRTYCQTRRNLTYESLVSLIRSHYGTEDSQEMLETMRKMKQEPPEKVVDYVRRVMAMRNRILEVNMGEEHEIGEEMVRKTCFRTISLGLRRDTIRLQVGAILSDHLREDNAVLEAISEVAALDKKHLQLLNPKGPEVCNLNTEFQSAAQVQATNAVQGVDNALLAKLTESLTTHVTELTAMRARLDKLEERWSKQGGDGKINPAGPNSKKVNFNMKCEPCKRDKLFCTHCAKCGKDDHKAKDCEEN